MNGVQFSGFKQVINLSPTNTHNTSCLYWSVENRQILFHTFLSVGIPSFPLPSTYVCLNYSYIYPCLGVNNHFITRVFLCTCVPLQKNAGFLKYILTANRNLPPSSEIIKLLNQGNLLTYEPSPFSNKRLGLGITQSSGPE